MADRQLTLEDVAQRAGVSRMTVSNVYNRPESVADETRDRVLLAAAELDYQGPSPAGRMLRRGNSGVVGMLLGQPPEYLFSDPGTIEFMQGVAEQADARDLSLQIISAGGRSAVRKVSDAVVDGWIVSGVPAGHPAFDAVLGRRQPTVTTPGPVLADGPCVSADVSAGTTAAIGHLLALGHQSIAIVTPPPTVTLESDPGGAVVSEDPVWGPRLAGCKAAVEAAGHDWGSVTIWECDSNTRRAGRAAAAALLNPPDPPTAIVAACDIIALGVLDWAREHGVAIPAQCSVVGFDDVDAAAVSDPPLTTVRQQLREQGRRVGQLAADQNNGPHQLESFAAELVVRASTGRPGKRR